MVKFPKINICPPKDTVTSLNVDLDKVKNISFNLDTRENLTLLAVELFQNQEFINNLKKQEMFSASDKYLNWYLGYSTINVPYNRVERVRQSKKRTIERKIHRYFSRI